MTLIRTDCALCDGNQYQIIQPGSLDERNIESAGFYSSSRKNAGYFPVVQCSTCGLARSLWRDDDLTLSSTYAGLEDERYDAEYENRLRTSQAYLGWVKRFCQQPRNLLDIGCSTGIFLTQAYRAGWKVGGLEPSNWAGQIASNRLPNASITVSTIDNASYPAQAFDAVTMWDVLEHLSNPPLALNRIHSWLQPSGWLFLNTPDISSPTARLLGRRWVLFLREHIWYFSNRTLSEMLVKCGFKPVATRSNSVRFSLGTVIERLNQSRDPKIRHWKNTSNEPRWLFRVPLKFPIGEVTVAAQKFCSPLHH